MLSRDSYPVTINIPVWKLDVRVQDHICPVGNGWARCRTETRRKMPLSTAMTRRWEGGMFSDWWEYGYTYVRGGRLKGGNEMEFDIFWFWDGGRET